jgi:hypothetical protein
MKLIETLLNLLRKLFGGSKKPRQEFPPDPDVAPVVEPEEAPEPDDEPEDEFDDPDYDVEHTTPDDDTERDPLPEPDADTVEAVLAKMSPLDLWKERQQWLVDVGYDPGPVDGKYGPKTEKAVRAFQKDHGLAVDGLAVDGMWGPKTQAARVLARKDKDKPASSFVPPPPVVGPAPGYDDMLGDVELDDEFWACFVDLTSKSNVKDSQGRRRRKGSRAWKNLKRLCWHQTAFTWKPYRVLKAARKWSSHHQTNAHACLDTDGTILLLHNFFYYLWTANAFNKDCFSFEIMGNFEGVLGTGNWYKPDKFGRGRPTRLQLVRARQFTKWLLDPEQGPTDDALPKPLLEWRKAVRDLGFNPLKWNNAHRQATSGRVLDCGSECWYHVVMWGVAVFQTLTVGPEAGSGMEIPPEWRESPATDPLPLAS